MMIFLTKKKTKTTNILYLVNAMIGLTLGLFIYIVFRPDTYLSKYLLDITHLRMLSNYMSERDNILISFARYYLCDFLWAYSMTFSVQIFLKANCNKRYIELIIYCLFFEFLIEGMQKFNIISGTFDIYDIVLEAAATLIALFLVNLREGESHEKSYI